jgi:ABC-2 type transport system permease protein
MTRGQLGRMRLAGFLRKEALQIRRDPSSIALALVMPIVLLFLFGYGVSLDAENVPVAIVMEHPGPQAREVAARLELSPNFAPEFTTSMEEARQWLDIRRVDAILRMPADFSADLGAEGSAAVQVILHGTDANRARLIQGYLRGVLQKWVDVRYARGEPVALPPVEVASRIWFNEGASSRNFLVPGLITLIMTLIGTLLTALVVAREWERGTMEAILVTPLRRLELMLGKILPYYVLGMGGMALSVGVGVTLFGVPFRGSWLLLVALASIFLLASLGFGLMVSAATRIQFVAAQISIVAGYLPALMLSGLIFDLESPPRAIQILSYLVPARYFVDISHTLFMAGNVWEVLLPNAAALAAMAAVFLTLAYRRITKRLES